MSNDPEILATLQQILKLQQESHSIQKQAYDLQQKAVENQSRAVRNQLATSRLYRIALTVGAVILVGVIILLIQISH
jgi:hypothetical protein